MSAAVATVPVSGDGTHTIAYFATDAVGNSGAEITLTYIGAVMLRAGATVSFTGQCSLSAPEPL